MGVACFAVARRPVLCRRGLCTKKGAERCLTKTGQGLRVRGRARAEDSAGAAVERVVDKGKVEVGDAVEGWDKGKDKVEAGDVVEGWDKGKGKV